MRILYVVHGYAPEAVGGVELHCQRLATALAGEHAVGVLAWQNDPNRPDYMIEERAQDGVTVFRLNHRFADLERFQDVYRNPRIDRLFDEVVTRFGPDVVHVHHLIGLSVGILERTRARGLPLVLGLHDFWFGCPRGQRIRDPLAICHTIDRRLCVPCLKPQNYELRAPRHRLGRWLRRLRPPTARRGLRILAAYDDEIRRLLALPNAIIVPSAFHRNAYRDTGVRSDAVHVVPYGLPTTAIAGAPRLPRDALHIGYLGTLIPSKGAHVLVDAYGLLARPEVVLDIHGAWVPFHGDTGYLDRLQKRAAEIPGTIRFHGRYEESAVPRILAGLDILVVPSVWWESYSIVIREGFLAGVPVVASRHGAMAEAIVHDTSGLLFTPGDAADLARQLRRLLETPDLGARLVAAPKPVASVAENAARHLALYAALGTGRAHAV
jgi:glycosyltransferase involved in cell wall biosynthesis